VDQEKIERALDACYDAILAPETWPEALHALARALDAACLMFYPRNPDPTSPMPLDPSRPLDRVPISSGYGELLDEYARNQWYLNHYRAQRGVPLLDSGRTVVLEHDMATDEERKRLRHYNDLYLRFGFPGYAMVGVEVEEGHKWAVPMLRTKAQGHFTPEDARRLAPLAPHFARMIRLSDRFALGQAQSQLDMLDRMACPAVLIDWKGAVIGRNAEADALMGADLVICRGTLMAADAAGNRALQNLVLWLRTTWPLRGVEPPAQVFIRRAGGRAPLAIEALPVAGRIADAFHRALAVLVISDLEVRPGPPEATLRAAFGLTAAEARLASRLGTGDSLENAANALGIAKETARSQLKAVYAKTGTSRQAQLVALLLRLPAGRLPA
jgi:DNA-binding CsgD family transcriptional regulator